MFLTRKQLGSLDSLDSLDSSVVKASALLVKVSALLVKADVDQVFQTQTAASATARQCVAAW